MQPKIPQQNQPVNGTMTWIMIMVLCFSVVALVKWTSSPQSQKIPFAVFLNAVKEKQIDTVMYDSRYHKITGTYKGADPKKKMTFESDGDLSSELHLKTLSENGITPNYVEIEQPGLLSELLPLLFPLLLIVGFFIFMQRSAKGAGGPLGNIMKSKAKLAKKNADITFAKIAGADEPKEEIMEMVDSLKNPSKYQRLGAKIPRGALLVGPPGTGKTMIAKAMANEAGANFLHLSGSDFVQMFVGLGAERVRDTFEQAKKLAPCIIFIDEIDAIGKSRDGKNGTGANDEREQTLNQLLVEMDGFETNANVIVLAATNRVDVLDKALLRPGRFDRLVYISLPDIKGRAQILEVHAKNKPMKAGIDFNQIARGTAGFSGAQLENLLNEAAIQAAKNNSTEITLEDIEFAKDKVMMGPERKTLIMSDKEKETTAWHEAGHTLVSHYTEGLDDVHKVSIIPRGNALGVTQTIAEENQLSLSKTKALNMIAMLMAGRAAEEIKFKHFTTGASNDIERASSIARRMVTEWGMSDMGPINLNKEHNGFVASYDFSEKTKETIDQTINNFLETGYKQAVDLLTKYSSELEKVSLALIDKETLDSKDLIKLLGERAKGKPSDKIIAAPSDKILDDKSNNIVLASV